MVRWIVAAAVAGFAAGPAWAQQPKANCKLYKRTSDGRWYSTIDSKVGNPKEFKVLKAGMAIDPSMTIVGLNVVDTINKLCGGQ